MQRACSDEGDDRTHDPRYDASTSTFRDLLEKRQPVVLSAGTLDVNIRERKGGLSSQ